MDLGRVGLWTTTFDGLEPAQAGEAAAEVEELGYGAVWFGEAYGREAFTQAQLLLGATSRMAVATGIASVYARDAVAANAAARTLRAVSGDRFVLGLGVSHAPLVERMRGHSYGKPVATMREFLDAYDAAPYLRAEQEPPPTRVLAALGPKMLELARDRADGAHPYLVTPDHTRRAREALGAGKLLAVEQAVVLTDDPEVFRRRAHAHLEVYTGLPNYVNNWVREGFRAEEDAVRGGSDRLKDALVAWGDEAAVAARVREHLDAGADHVCVQVLGDGPLDPPREDWRRLAPALLEL